MSTDNDPALITRLRKLAEADDRAALAALRRGIGKPPGTEIATYPHVVPFIPNRDSEPQRAWPYFVVASLFGAHPVFGTAENLGATFRRLKESPSRDARFRALLNAHSNELPGHLRQAVRQLASASISIDWATLLKDLRCWSDPAQRVQQRWARAFWSDTKDAKGIKDPA